jgi:CYTH domain-containing protein
LPIEIERKFLVVDDTWKSAAIARRQLRDGLIARFDSGKVRVRLEQGKAWLTIKGPKTGCTRQEFEYQIPYAEADEMLHTLCSGPIIEKTRHIVPHNDLMWEVDVHEGVLHGLVLAEVELQYEGQELFLPSWIGSEVTDNPRYRKSSLLSWWRSGWSRIAADDKAD